MSRLLIVIPVMYEGEELRQILGEIPSDFEETYSEFWDYVEVKLNPFIGKIRRVYSDKLSTEREETRAASLLKKLVDNRAEFHCVEDSMLAAEAEAWLEMMETGSVKAARELYDENLVERDEYARETIAKTLMDSEIGVLFVSPARKISFPEDVKVVKMFRFDPVDYLNRHLTKLGVRREGKSD